MRAAILVLVAVVCLLVGCGDSPQKKYQAVAPAVRSSMSDLRAVDRDLAQHMGEAREAQAAGHRFDALHKMRAVIEDYRRAKKAVDTLMEEMRKAIGMLAKVHEIDDVRIKGMQFSNEAFCVGAPHLDQPVGADCLEKCENAWGKLADATAVFSASAKSVAGLDVPQMRDK
jgi:hypothetical protein